MDKTICLVIARKHASHFTHQNVKEYSQWFPGKKNYVADSLSRDFDLKDAEISEYLHLHYPSQLPPLFQVLPVPSKIELWLIPLLQQLPEKEQLWEPQMITKSELNDNGPSTLNTLGLTRTPSSTASTDASGTSLSAPLPQPSEKQEFQAMLSKPWLQEQSEIPSQVYARPSGSTDARTLQKTKTFNLASFCNDTIDRTPRTTRNRSSKMPSQYAPLLQAAGGFILA
jgi:hypothetical protein